MNSPDYLFMSTQISQALLHGVSILSYRHDKLIELTKLKVKAPLTLIEFKTSRNQENYANNKGINLEPFGRDDIKLIQYICSSVPGIDGYRAQWDQDQVTVCARVIRSKLERVSTHVFRKSDLPIDVANLTFNTPEKLKDELKHAMYYMINYGKNAGKRLMRNVKKKEKENAIKRKVLRVRTFGIGNKTGGVKAPPNGTTFKRSILVRRKK
jgi:hypothetical protein